MRLARAIDRFLEQMRVERDWTPRTIASVYDCLRRLADTDPDARLHDYNGRPGTDRLRQFLAHTYGHTSSSTRATRISYLHSFFAWAEEEGHVDDDPARRIKRPPKRKPDVYRPAADEIAALLRYATARELAPLLLMSGAGLRAAETCALTWADVDLTRDRVRLRRKGGHRQTLPLDPLVAERLRRIHRTLDPAPADHVFTAETEQWVSQEHRIRETIDPATPRAPKALWAMVGRVSRRAGIRPLGPHALRHGFANQFLVDTRDRFGVADVHTLQLLMGHSRIDTTQHYLRDLEAQEAGDVLNRLRDVSQAAAGTAGAVPAWMEAAGIEPASAAAPDDATGGTEPEEPRSSSERRRAGQPEVDG